MLIFLLLRRLSPRAATITGAVLAAAGTVLVALAIAMAAGLLIHGIALVVTGAIFCTSAIVSRRRARPAAQTEPVTAPAMAGHGK
jgi:drug/metabolite transporter (DMT)-like permease